MAHHILLITASEKLAQLFNIGRLSIPQDKASDHCVGT